MTHTDYDPAYESEPAGFLSTLHLPFMILALGVALFLYAQVSNIGQNASSMRWQAANLERQLAALADSEQSLATLAEQRTALVQQSEQIQSRYSDLLADILELSKTDPDARAVAEKYGIQRRENPAEPTPNPPATATPTR